MAVGGALGCHRADATAAEFYADLRCGPGPARKAAHGDQGTIARSRPDRSPSLLASAQTHAPPFAPPSTSSFFPFSLALFSRPSFSLLRLIGNPKLIGFPHLPATRPELPKILVITLS